MADFLDRLLARNLAPAAVVRPRPASRFEPSPALAIPTGDGEQGAGPTQEKEHAWPPAGSEDEPWPPVVSAPATSRRPDSWSPPAVDVEHEPPLPARPGRSGHSPGPAHRPEEGTPAALDPGDTAGAVATPLTESGPAEKTDPGSVESEIVPAAARSARSISGNPAGPQPGAESYAPALRPALLDAGFAGVEIRTPRAPDSDARPPAAPGPHVQAPLAGIDGRRRRIAAAAPPGQVPAVMPDAAGQAATTGQEGRPRLRVTPGPAAPGGPLTVGITLDEAERGTPRPAVEPGALRPAAVRSPSTDTGPGSAAPTPTIQVTIGRIEVRAAAPAASPPPRRSPAPPMSLDEYMKSRHGGTP